MRTIGNLAFIGLIVAALAIITGVFVLIAKRVGGWIWWITGGLVGAAYVIGVGLIVVTLKNWRG